MKSKTISFYTNHQSGITYSCTVSNRLYNKLKQLENIGGFKRFSMDLETENQYKTDATIVTIWYKFLVNVFWEAKMNDCLTFVKS